VIALDGTSVITALGVHPNESEDLSILDKICVADKLNDIMAGLNL
jgi:hypothetical protein